MVRFPTGRRNEEGRRKLILPKNRKRSAMHGKMDMELDVFCPTESELFTFLLRFIAKKPLYDDGFITELDVYKQPPWVTYSYGRNSCGVEQNEHDNSSVRYFIIPISENKRKSICRIVDGKIGRWRETWNKKIINRGRMMRLTYEEDKKDERWIIQEYQLSETLARKFKKDICTDYVICALRKIYLNKKIRYKKKLKSTAQRPKREVLSKNEVEMIKFFEESILMESNAQIEEECMITDFDKLMLGNNETSAVVFGQNKEKSSFVDHLVEAMSELEVDK